MKLLIFWLSYLWVPFAIACIWIAIRRTGMIRFVVIGAAGFLAPVARRWKTQLNENGKANAVYEELPEATHNKVAVTTFMETTWEPPAELRGMFFVESRSRAQTAQPQAKLSANTAAG